MLSFAYKYVRTAVHILNVKDKVKIFTPMQLPAVEIMQYAINTAANCSLTINKQTNMKIRVKTLNFL